VSDRSSVHSSAITRLLAITTAAASLTLPAAVVGAGFAPDHSSLSAALDRAKTPLSVDTASEGRAALAGADPATMPNWDTAPVEGLAILGSVAPASDTMY
jgi:hypothetical protein